MPKTITIIGTVLLSLAIIASIIFLGVRESEKPSSKPTEETTQNTSSTNTAVESSEQPQATKPAGITMADVEAHTGKDGQACWVAVSGEVYEISGFVVWVDGVHTPSGGRARCGKDLTQVIGQSPHGSRVLKLLNHLGPLQQ